MGELYVRYVELDPPYLTGWGLYIIKKGLLLLVSNSGFEQIIILFHWNNFNTATFQVAGNVLTYVLVLYGI